MKFWNILFLLVLLVSSCSTLSKKYSNNPELTHIVILHTNDSHGHAWPHKKAGGNLWGGFARQAEIVKKIREEIEREKGIVLVLSAGDVNTGVPESDLLNGEPDFFAMNKIGYDAMVLGNHEFDKGTDKIIKQKTQANFPFLTANIRFKDNSLKEQASLALPSVLLEKGGVKIGIVGLTTDSLKTLVLPKHTANLEIENALTAAKREIAILKKKDADLLIALTHLGVENDNSLHKRKIGTSDNTLANIEDSLSVIVGGHSHTLLEQGIRVKNTLIVQAGEKGEHLGRVDLYWDKKNKKVLESSASIIALNSEIAEDTLLSKDLESFKDSVGTKLQEKIGYTSVLLDGERNRIRYRESNLGNLITDVLREFTQADISVFNGGGIRASIPMGPIKLRDVYIVFPFNNTIQTAMVSGKQLKILIQQGLKNLETVGSLLHISGGKYSAAKNQITEISVAGKPVQESKLYKLVTNSFVMAGGDFYTILTEAKDLKDTGVTVDRALIEYLYKHPNISPKIEGRINITN